MSDTTFGDFDLADAYDTEPADALQVGIRLHLIRQRLERLVGRDLPSYHELGGAEQGDLHHVGLHVVEWLATHDSSERDGLARTLVHTDWDEFTPEEQQLARDVADLIADWLIRQGAWR